MQDKPKLILNKSDLNDFDVLRSEPLAWPFCQSLILCLNLKFDKSDYIIFCVSKYKCKSLFDDGPRWEMSGEDQVDNDQSAYYCRRSN